MRVFEPQQQSWVDVNPRFKLGHLECPSLGAADVCTVYSPRPIKIESERSGKCRGSAALRRARKSASEREFGVTGNSSPSPCASSTMRDQFSGVRTTRAKRHNTFRLQKLGHNDGISRRAFNVNSTKVFDNRFADSRSAGGVIRLSPLHKASCAL